MCSGNTVTRYYGPNKCVAYMGCVKKALNGPPLIVSITAKKSSDDQSITEMSSSTAGQQRDVQMHL